MTSVTWTPLFVGLVVGAYLLGAIPFGLVLVRLFKRQDVRTQGSGNIGATNVTRVAGRTVGALTLGLDALKGWAPVVTGRLLGLTELECSILGAMSFVGHCFPVYLRFRGGKGVATGLGVIAGLRPYAAAVAIAAFVVSFLVTRISSVSCIVGMAAVAVIAWREGVSGELVALLCAMLCISLFKLAPNIKRLVVGRELKF